MKISLLHLYANVPTGGEHTYGFHLQDGFRELGHECDINVFSKSGKVLKNYEGKNFIVNKTENIRDVLKEYDAIVFLTGHLEKEFKTKADYSYLKGLPVIAAIEHSGIGTWKRYNFPELLNVVGNIPIYGNSKSSCKSYKEIYDYDLIHLRQPFSRNILPPKIEHDKDTNLLNCIFPHRFNSVKHPEYTYFFFKDIENINFLINFYGSYGESTLKWQFENEVIDGYYKLDSIGKKSIVPNVFKDTRFLYHDVFKPMNELSEVFKDKDLLVHSAHQHKYGGLMEYALLESIFYGVPIMSSNEKWCKDIPTNLIDDAWVEGISYIDMTKERLTQFNNDLQFRKDLLKSSNKILDKYFNAKNAAIKILKRAKI